MPFVLLISERGASLSLGLGLPLDFGLDVRLPFVSFDFFGGSILPAMSLLLVLTRFMLVLTCRNGPKYIYVCAEELIVHL